MSCAAFLEIEGGIFFGKENKTYMFTEKEVAEKLKCTVSTLRKWRTLGKGLTYRKIGRLVRYSEADIAAYLEANRVEPTGGAL